MISVVGFIASKLLLRRTFQRHVLCTSLILLLHLLFWIKEKTNLLQLDACYFLG